MKINKKIALGIIAPLITISPLVAVISCGNSKKDETEKKSDKTAMEESVIGKTPTDIRVAYLTAPILEFEGVESEEVLTKLFKVLANSPGNINMLVGKALKVADALYDQFTIESAQKVKDIIKKDGKITILQLSEILGWDSYEHGRIVSQDHDVELINKAINKKINPSDKTSTDPLKVNDWRNDQFRPLGPKDQMRDDNHQRFKHYNLRPDAITFLLSPNHKSNILSHWNILVNAKVGDMYRFNFTPSVTNIVSRMFAFSDIKYRITDTRFWRIITPKVLEKIKTYSAEHLGEKFLDPSLPDPLAQRMTNKNFRTPKMRSQVRTIELKTDSPDGWHKAFRYGYTIIGDKFNMKFGKKYYQITITANEWDFLKMTGVNGTSSYRNPIKIIAKLRQLFIDEGYEIDPNNPNNKTGKRPPKDEVNKEFRKLTGSQHVPKTINVNDIDPNDTVVYLDQGSASWHQLFKGSGTERALPKRGTIIGIRISFGKEYWYKWSQSDIDYLTNKGWMTENIDQQFVVDYIIKKIADANKAITEKDIKRVLTFGHHGIKV